MDKKQKGAARKKANAQKSQNNYNTVQEKNTIERENLGGILNEIINNPDQIRPVREIIKSNLDIVKIYAFIKHIINEKPAEITVADTEESLLYGVYIITQYIYDYTNAEYFGTIEEIKNILRECLKAIRNPNDITPYNDLLNEAKYIFNETSTTSKKSPNAEANRAARGKVGITTGTAAAIGRIPKNGIISFDPIIDKTFCELPLKGINLINNGAFAIDVTSDADRKKNKPSVLVKVELEQKLEEIETDLRIKIKKQDGTEEAFNNLSPEIKRLYMALWAIDEECGKANAVKVSLTTICNTLYRGDKSPGKNQIEKTLKQLNLLGATRISIDNAQEAAAYPSKEKVNIKSAPLLTLYVIERENIFGNKTIEILYNRSIIWDFIERRGHYTTPLLTVTKPYLNDTAINAAVEDYIKGRIAQMKHSKNKKYSHKIRFNTIYEKYGIKERLKKHRIKDRILGISKDGLLHGLKKDKYITDFKPYPNREKPEGVEIILPAK